MVASGTVLVVEVWASRVTGSLALLSDAAHLFVDLSGLLLAYVALRLASRPADDQATFGYLRMEVLAAAINGLLVAGMAVAIVWRAIRRLREPLDDLDVQTVLAVAVLGLVANLVAAWLLRRHAEDNINIKGAFLHVLGDALASVAVIVSAILVHVTGRTAWDTYVSFAVAAIIVVAAGGLLRGAVAILLERAPSHLAPRDIKDAVERLPDVHNVHDLHVWTLTPGRHSLSMHVTIAREATDRYVQVIEAIEDVLEVRFDLDHCTIQVEPEGHDPVSDRHDPVA